LILFLAVLFNILFLLAYRRGGKLRAAARDQVRATIQEATGIREFRQLGLAMTILPYVLITGLFCVPYATIYLGLSSGPGATRHMTRGFPPGALIPLAVMALVLLSVLKKAAIDRASAAIIQHLHRADYDGALSQTDRRLQRFPHSPRFLSLRGVILLFAGRLQEAEQVLRDGLGKARIDVRQIRGGRVLQAGATHTVMLVNLGHVLLLQDRSREATAAFEGATKLFPKAAWSASNGLAEVCLRHDREPQRALQFADRALQLRKENNASPNADRHNLAYMWANRARALALLRRIDEAEASLEHTMKDGDPDNVPGSAGTLWRSGLALLNMDRESEAIRQFQRGREIDPKGLYGNLCAAALREHGVRT
jgi:tetratricopeptide (TPR) repeat protein